MSLGTAAPWRIVGERDPRVLDIVDGTGRHAGSGAHYSRRTIGATRGVRGGFVGVGESLVLLSDDETAAWSVVHQRDPRGGEVWRNNVFRSLGAALSSDLIRWAVRVTFLEWTRKYKAIPRPRLRTEIDSRHVVSGSPGHCYRCAGWRDIDGAPSSASRRPWMVYLTPSSRVLRDAHRFVAANLRPEPQLGLFTAGAR